MDRLGLARRLGAAGRVAEASAGALVIEERDAAAFMGAFARAAATDAPVFLADPSWGAGERAALARMLADPEARTGAGRPGRGWLMIPSGGTGGRIKFARHDEETISAAVRGFCGHFRVERVNWVGILPLHHVSGLMAWMRTALTGGRYVPWDWKRLESGEFPAEPPAARPEEGGRWCLSLVPTQLQRLLGGGPAGPGTGGAIGWLRRFDAVFLGGGPAWPGLVSAAARAGLPVSLSYGMTETAAMAAALRPGEFLAGDRSAGSPLPHVRVEVDAEGLVRVAGESVFRGYFPGWAPGSGPDEAPRSAGARLREFTTEDLGSIDGQGRLHLLGRRDAVIITGGKKVDPFEVEAALRASGEFSDVAVVGLPDAEWGQVVAAVYPAGGRPPDLDRALSQLGPLAAFKRPRRFVPIAGWPRTAQGKLNRVELVRLAGPPVP